MKRKRFFIALVASLLLLLAGCGSKTAANKAKNPDEYITRAEYIGMLGSVFGYDKFISEGQLLDDVPKSNQYYNFIQASAEWEIIDSDGKFKPDESATLDFAMDAAVRAIGLDIIELSGADLDRNDLCDFFVNNVAALDTSDLNRKVTRSTAEMILEYSNSYRHGIVLPQKVEAVYKDGIVESDGSALLNEDMDGGILIDSSKFKVGDIVYWDIERDGVSCAARISGIDGNSFTCVPVGIEEVFESLAVSGTYEGQVTNVHTASESVEIANEMYDEMSKYGGMKNTETHSISQLANSVVSTKEGEATVFTLRFDVSQESSLGTVENLFKRKSQSSGGGGNGAFGGGGIGSRGSGDKNDEGKSEEEKQEAESKAGVGAELKIKIKKITLTYDIDNVIWPKHLDVKFNMDAEASTTVRGSVGLTVPIGFFDVPIVPGLVEIRFKLNAHIGVDGKITLSYTTDNIFEAHWKKGCDFATKLDSNSSWSMEGVVKAAVEPTFIVDIRVGIGPISTSLVNVQASTGIAIMYKSSLDLRNPEPVCIDQICYIPLKWAYNQESCIATKISKKFKGEYEIWNSENSPIRTHVHYEDGEEVPECTRGKKEKVEQLAVDEDGKPLDEYKIFDFEPIEFDFIILESYKTILMPGDIAEIKFSEIPEGYDKSSLTYEVQDTSICSVENGVVTGKAPGSTIVKISTADGLFSAYLAVTVNDDYSSTGFDGL